MAADPKYALSKTWDCTTTEVNAAAKAQLPALGGGWVATQTAGTPEWSWELRPNAYIGDIGAGTGVVLTGTNAGLTSSVMNLFGAHLGNITEYNAESPTYNLIEQAYPSSGTLEFYITLASLPTTEIMLIDTNYHFEGTYFFVGMQSISIKATTGEIQIETPGTVSKSTGLFITAGVETHVFYQYRDVGGDTKTFTIGVGGTYYSVSGMGAIIASPVQNMSIGHCSKYGESGHTSNHGVVGTIRHIRYTHWVNRYPFLPTNTPTAYTPDAAPFDYADHGVSITGTLIGDDYIGPPALINPDNVTTPVRAPVDFEMTSVSGSVPPYTYRWYERHRGPIDESVNNDSLLEFPTDQLNYVYESELFCVVTDSIDTAVVFGPKTISMSATNGEEYVLLWVPNLHVDVGQSFVAWEPLAYGYDDPYGYSYNGRPTGDYAVINNTSAINTEGGPPQFLFFTVQESDIGKTLTLELPTGPSVRGTGTVLLTDPWDSTDDYWWNTHVRTREWPGR